MAIFTIHYLYCRFIFELRCEIQCYEAQLLKLYIDLNKDYISLLNDVKQINIHC